MGRDNPRGSACNHDKFAIRELRIYALGVLRAQDLLVAVALAAHPERKWTYAALGKAVGLSLSEAHASFDRAAHAGLVNGRTRRVVRPALQEFLVHGFRYVFPPELGPKTRGVPTGANAPPLAQHLASAPSDPIVWPYARGEARGEALTPIYKTVPRIALEDSKLYALLATADALRSTSPRVRGVAARVLSQLLGESG